MAGRIYPFSYKRTKQDTSEYFSDLLRRYNKEVKWLLDLRSDPEDSWDQYRGEWLRDNQAPDQYLHVLSDTEKAVNGVVTLLQRDESFVLFHDDWGVVKSFESKIYYRAEERGVDIEDPYTIHPGDVCRWTNKDEQADNLEVVVNFRQPDVFSFHVHTKDPLVRDKFGFEISTWADFRDLTRIELGAFLCQECKRGENTVQWREKAGKKLCKHCNWEMELNTED